MEDKGEFVKEDMEAVTVKDMAKEGSLVIMEDKEGKEDILVAEEDILVVKEDSLVVKEDILLVKGILTIIIDFHIYILIR